MRRVLAGLAFAALVAVAVVTLLGGPVEPEAPDWTPQEASGVVEDEELEAARRPPAVPPAALVELPEGSLEPIIGEPRPDDLRFCDDDLWRGVAPLLVALHPPGEAVVDEVAWQGYGASARAGIASWISKCHLGGEPVVLSGDLSGRRLGRYADDIGFRPEPSREPRGDLRAEPSETKP